MEYNLIKLPQEMIDEIFIHIPIQLKSKLNSIYYDNYCNTRIFKCITCKEETKHQKIYWNNMYSYKIRVCKNCNSNYCKSCHCLCVYKNKKRLNINKYKKKLST